MRRFPGRYERVLVISNMVALSLVLLALIGWVDYATGNSFSFMPFYLLPVILATRHAGFSAGVAFSVLSGVIWLWADLAAGRGYSNILFPVWNAFVRIVFFLSPVFFFELRNALAREVEESKRDYLTRIRNRKGFIEAAFVELERSKRYGHPFTAIMIDCDGFRGINDRFGHAEGDALLQASARTLRDNLRSCDVAARIGGDEFMILLPETGYEQSAKLIARLREQLSALMKRFNRQVTFCVGAITFEKPPQTVVELLKRCDMFLFSAKSKGTGRLEHGVFQ